MGKKVPGRKRGLAVDALGLIIAVMVTAASVTDTVIGVRPLDKVVQCVDHNVHRVGDTPGGVRG